MGLFRRVKNDFVLAFTGLQEATLAVAERVNKRVQEVKASLEAAETENQIKMDQSALGEKIYHRGDADLRNLQKESDFNALFNKIQEGQKKLKALEDQDSLKDLFVDFERLMVQSDWVIQSVMVPKDFSGIGRALKEVAIPSDMRIILVKKKNQLLIAHDDLMIGGRDQITFICPRSNMSEIMAFWNKS